MLIPCYNSLIACKEEVYSITLPQQQGVLNLLHPAIIDFLINFISNSMTVFIS